MHIYNRTHVLLSTLFYMFQHLLCRLQGELSHLLKTILIIVGILQIYVITIRKIHRMESHAKFILFGLHIVMNVIAVVLNVSLFQDAGGRLGFCFGDRSSK
jgi:hypothetical protein